MSAPTSPPATPSGCNAFVRKPVDYEEYTRDLRTTLEFWLNVNRVPPPG